MTASPANATPADTARPAAYGWRRIAVTVLVVIALMALGLVAGRWQWGRYEDRSEALDAHHRAEELPTVQLESLMTAADSGPGDAAWRAATVTGVIDSGNIVELRGRSIDDIASIQYLAWIHTPAGESILLNLGWTTRSQPITPLVPEGEVTVTGTVRALETDNGKDGTRITPAQMGSVDGQVFQAYLMVTSACGDTGCVEGIEPVPLPELSLGPHLSYALQWWLLMVAAAPVAVILTRREAHHERERAAASAVEDESSPPKRGAPKGSLVRRSPAKNKPPSDEEIEDAL